MVVILTTPLKVQPSSTEYKNMCLKLINQHHRFADIVTMGSLTSPGGKSQLNPLHLISLESTGNILYYI